MRPSRKHRERSLGSPGPRFGSRRLVLGRMNLVDTYHRSGEGDDSVTVGTREPTRSKTRRVVGQIALIGNSQACKGGEG